MKKIVLFSVFLLLGVSIKAQDPDVFNQTWYLYEIVDIESDLFFNVEEYQPYDGNPEIAQINPSFSIDNDFHFSGTGICNNFAGTLEYDVDGNSFGAVSSTVETASCGFYEDMDEPIIIGPFGFVNSEHTIINPLITDDSDGYQTFTFITQPFVSYTYRNVSVLSVNDVTKHRFKVYPNPTSDLIKFSSNTSSIISVQVYSVSGNLVKELSNQNSIHEISLTSIKNGVYFMRVLSDDGVEVHRVLKK